MNKTFTKNVRNIIDKVEPALVYIPSNVSNSLSVIRSEDLADWIASLWQNHGQNENI